MFIVRVSESVGEAEIDKIHFRGGQLRLIWASAFDPGIFDASNANRLKDSVLLLTIHLLFIFRGRGPLQFFLIRGLIFWFEILPDHAVSQHDVIWLNVAVDITLVVDTLKGLKLSPEMI